MSLENIRNIDAIKTLEKGLDKNPTIPEESNKSIDSIEDEMRTFTIKDFHLKAKGYADFIMKEKREQYERGDLDWEIIRIYYKSVNIR